MHAVGKSHVQHLRLAEAVLSARRGYVQTFRELIDTTDWAAYGRASGNPHCRNCMVHCGYEPTAVSETFGSLRGLWGAARTMLFGSSGRQNHNATASSLSPRCPIVNTAPTGCEQPLRRTVGNLRGHSLARQSAVDSDTRADMILR